MDIRLSFIDRTSFIIGRIVIVVAAEYYIPFRLRLVLSPVCVCSAHLPSTRYPQPEASKKPEAPQTQIKKSP